MSPRLLRLFVAYLAWYVPRHFHALRVAHAERFPRARGPLIVCINHASWWDPLIILTLSRFLAPGCFAYAPMEAAALEHYGFFRRIGAFPVDNHSPRAAAQFLRQSASVLALPDAILWMTPEGHFTDVRVRPVQWKPGTAALTRHLDECTVVPLALEYTFWDERLPEALCMVGEPIEFTRDSPMNVTERNLLLQAAMTTLQDQLTSRAVQRNGALFTPVFLGDTGIGATYNLFQRMKAALHGEAYVPEHTVIAPK